MLMTRYEPLIFNANFTETSSDGKYVAYRGELTICEGEVADAQGRRKPPTEVLKQVAVLGEGDSLKFLTGSLDTVAQRPDLIARFGADITADTQVVLFVIDATKEMTVEVNGAKMYLIPLSEGMAWNELIDVLALEKSDFKGQSGADKVVTLYKAVCDYKPKFAVVSVDEAAAASNGAKREMWGAV